MMLQGIENQTVDFRIVGYQFPQIDNDHYDSNWLIIEVRVESNSGKWVASDPALLTFEFQEIIDWLEAIYQQPKTTAPFLDFIEPNLQFEFLAYEDTNFQIRMRFDYELLPENAIQEKCYFVDVEWDLGQLLNVIIGLKQSLAAFPER